MEAFAWGDNAEGCLGLARGTSAALLPRELELHGLLPSERVVSLACSERYSGDSDGTASFASGVGGVSGLCSSIFSVWITPKCCTYVHVFFFSDFIS